MSEDNWEHRSAKMMCATCMYWVEKVAKGNPQELNMVKRLGRCRRHAPTMKGWPAVFDMDWCGDHKLDENKV